ncbi:MAG: hypothetical protein HUJ26_17485 [Planctomycetaceae bacterium]|nr:hypothetical protein [Planctomycetaceae bacterium]
MFLKFILPLGLSLILLTLPLEGKPGKGGGPRKSGFKRGPSRAFSPSSQKPAGNFGKSLNRGTGNSLNKLTGRDRAVSIQRQNELSKFQHRQQTAQKLRDLSELNGNENLKSVADKMDQRALDHFEKRNAKIDQLAQRGTETPFDQNQFADPLDQPLTERQIQKLNDPALQQQHRLLNEERKLQHQMQVAQQIRDIAAQNGNANLLQTAQKMELTAAERYASQFQKILGAPATPLTAPLP